MTDDRDIPRDIPRDGADDDFAERIARPLRGGEHVDPTFDARVMSAVFAYGPHTGHAPRPGWWRRRTMTPLATLAVAAGTAAIALLGAWGASAIGSGTPDTAAVQTAAQPETVHVVRFVFAAQGARSVALVGDFNGWSKTATPLVEESAPGVWTASVVLPRGRHEYAFIVARDGSEEWKADPFAARVRDDFDTPSSVVTVGANASSAAGSS